MSAQNDIEQLKEAFGEKVLKSVEFRGEQTVYVALDALHAVMAKCHADLGYEMILDISSLDHFGDDPRWEMVYEIATLDDRRHLRVKAALEAADGAGNRPARSRSYSFHQGFTLKWKPPRSRCSLPPEGVPQWLRAAGRH